MRPHYAHARQRSFYSLDAALSEQVERVEQPRPEPIPFGEARELQWPAQPFPASWSALSGSLVGAVADGGRA